MPESCPPWGEPQNLGPPVNSDVGERTPCISSDSKTIYFTRTGMAGSEDIYYTTWNGTAWSLPDKIPGMVNSVYYEAKPFISSDGKNYFLSQLDQVVLEKWIFGCQLGTALTMNGGTCQLRSQY